MDRPLRLISTDTIVGTPIDALARTLEALLVVASQPLTTDELAEAAARTTRSGSRRRSGSLRERYSEGRSGIVLERVVGRLRVPRRARGRRGLRPAVRAAGRAWPLAGRARDARDRRVHGAGLAARDRADPRRGGRLDRRLPRRARARREAGRESGPGGAVRYRVTPLFERVFALDSLAELPRLDDLGGEPEAIRERLLAVAEARAS